MRTASVHRWSARSHTRCPSRRARCSSSGSTTTTRPASWQLSARNVGFDLEQIAYAVAPASGVDAVTVTLDQVPMSFFEIRVHEYHGASATPYDGEGKNVGTTGAATVDVTTHRPGEMVFAMGILDTGAAGAGYTLRQNYLGDVTEDRIVDTPQTLPAVVTYAGAAQWTISAVVFAPGG